MKCPSQIEIVRVLTGQLSPARTDDLFAHLESCESCGSQIEKIEDSIRTETSDSLSSLLRVTRPDEPRPESCRQLIEQSLDLINDETCGSDVADYMASIERIRDYQLRVAIGGGGMGRVYLATHKHLKRDVAIKVLSPSRFGNQFAMQRFRGEMEAVGQLDHANIVRALDAGEHDGILYLAMEYVSGIDLGTLLQSVPRLSLPDAAAIARQVAEGLAYAHAKGLVHRDIKPTNVMLTDRGKIRILDFGLALLGRGEGGANEASFVGSIEFMAPEQSLDASRVDESADVFSLGCTLYQMLTGHTPYPVDGEATPLQQLAQRAGIAEKSDVEVPRALPRVVTPLLLSMIHPDASQRPSAADVADALLGMASDADLRSLLRQVPAAPIAADSRSMASDRAASRHRIHPAILIALALGLPVLVLLVYSIFFKPMDRSSPTTPGTIRAATAQDLFDATNAAVFRLATAEVSGRIDGKPARVSVAPGFEILVTIGEPTPAEFRSWDLLDLKLKHDSAFQVYEAFSSTLVMLHRDSEGHFPFSAPPPDHVSQAITLLVSDQGSDLLYAWTQHESVRMIRKHDGRSAIQVSSPEGMRSRVFGAGEAVDSGTADEFSQWRERFERFRSR